MSAEDKEIGDRVRERLTTLGRTEASLCSDIGLEKSKMSRSLSGDRRLTSGEIAAIADATGVDAYYLITGTRSPYEPKIAARHDFDRETGHYSAELSEMRGQFARLVRVYDGAGLVSDRGARLREVSSCVAPSAEWTWVRSAVAVARELWRAGGYTDPIGDLRRFLAEQLGVDLIVLDGEESTRAAAFAVDLKGQPAIVLRQTGAWYSAAFAIWHEVAHLLAGELLFADELSRESAADSEPFANGFAADMLLPRDSVREVQSGAASLEDLASYLWDRGAGVAALNTRLGVLNKGWGDFAAEVLRRTPSQHEIAAEQEELVGEDAYAVRRMTWRAPMFPEYLIEAHRSRVQRGQVGGELLAWMEGVPIDDVLTEDSAGDDEDDGGLSEMLGLAGATA